MLRAVFVMVWSALGVCAAAQQPASAPAAQRFTGAAAEVRLITLDPGHFHAALVQKAMYKQISPVVHVYAPAGPDLTEHLKRIEGFNTRAEQPTAWQERVYTGADYLKRLLTDRSGNVVVISGNNQRKTEYINACVDAGLNVLADKPMCIDAAGLELLEQAFDVAAKKNVLLYDIMTERSEITTILQRELIAQRELFGELQPGTPEEPGVVKESVHHFFKSVAGSPLKRPAWYFDTAQQGEGLVDVTTHLIDLVMWTCFPEQALDFDHDVRMLSARRWPTAITRAQFEQVTGMREFPAYLREQLAADGTLPCSANGEMSYTMRGLHVRIAVRWDFAPPVGGGDTHASVARGSRANVLIRQGREQQYRPELYVEAAAGVPVQELAAALKSIVAGWQKRYPGVKMEPADRGWWIRIPDALRTSHEAHFQEVVERYLQYLREGKLPAWEVPNMLTKYRITTSALERARQAGR